MKSESRVGARGSLGLVMSINMIRLHCINEQDFKLTNKTIII